MIIEELQQLHEILTKEGHDLLSNKGNDYSGHTETDTLANIKSCGQFGIPPLQGIVTRLLDKMSRLASFSKGVENKVKDDTVRDAVIDIINYAVIWYAVRKEQDEEQLKKFAPNYVVPPGPNPFEHDQIRGPGNNPQLPPPVVTWSSDNTKGGNESA
jgi:hypothetical protein